MSGDRWTYKTYETVPTYEAPIFPDPAGGSVSNPAVMKWGGTLPPPAIGTEIVVTVNRIGPATVLGYFSEHNWLGLRVKVHAPPAWYVKQNGPNHVGHVFGPEFKLKVPA